MVATSRWADGRKCKSCKQNKPLKDYYLRSIGTPFTLCKICYNKDSKERARARPIEPPDKKRRCNSCKQEKENRLFVKNINSAGGYLSTCKKCHSKLNGIRKWGVSIEDYTHCGLCGDELTPNSRTSGAVVDHDHSCCPGNRSCGKCIRGVICPGCNVGLGMFKDDPTRLSLAIKYLEKWSN